MSYCTFCNEVKTNVLQINGVTIDNVICRESSSFVALPSLGSFVPGYLLIVPKVHTFSFASLEKNMLKEFWLLFNKIMSRVQHIRGPYIMFEHGSTLYDIGGSCCQHAHMHLVPYCGKTTLAHYVQGKNITGINKLPKHYAYIYLFEHGQHMVKKYNHTTMGSQYLRKIIARTNNYWGEERNWRKYPFEENIEESLLNFKKHQAKTIDPLLPC